MFGKKVVVLGASGFVGHAVVNELSKQGYEIVCCVRRPDRHRDLALYPNTKLVQVMEPTSESLQSVLNGQNIVVNLLSDPSLASEAPEDLVDLTQKLKQACDLTGIQRILQLSQIGANSMQTEHVYSAKLGEVDSIIFNATAGVTILKSGLLLGQGDETSDRFARQLDRLPLLPVYHGETLIQPLSVLDFAKAFVQAIEKKELIAQKIELVGEERLSLKALALLVKEMKDQDHAMVLPMCRLNAKIMSKLGGFAPICSVSQAQLDTICCDLISETDFSTTFGFEPRSIEMALSPYVTPHSMRARYNDFRQEAGRDVSELI